MNWEVIVALGRMVCGTALLITSMITGIDGNIQMISLVLLGIPFEAVQRVTKETE